MPLKPLPPFFSYFGAKHRIARHYPTPVHDTIIEPFAGSAAYACAHYNKHVVLYDVSPQICGVWSYLIKTPESDILALPLLGEGETVDDLAVSQEVRWLIGFWLARGSAWPKKSPSMWMRSGIRPRSFWSEVIKQRIAGGLRHIRHWKVENRAYTDIPNQLATWFIDPPYQVAGKNYPFHNIDYPHLGGWCHARMGQVVVCENSGADWLPFSHFMEAKGTKGKGRTGKSSEVLWVGNN